MKYWTFILILFCSYEAIGAQKVERELLFGALTYHFVDYNSTARSFSNKLSSDGKLIANPTIGFMHRKFYSYNKFYSNAVFMMEDSIGSKAFGFIRTYGEVTENNFYLGVLGGTYLINHKNWSEQGIKPPIKINITNYYAFIPLIGLQFSKKFEIGDNYYLKINNILTFYLTNHTLSIGKSF